MSRMQSLCPIRETAPSDFQEDPPDGSGAAAAGVLRPDWIDLGTLAAGKADLVKRLRKAVHKVIGTGD